MSLLVGRSRELLQLKQALARATAGHGGLALLAGEPGIGKTRLADELARAAAEQGTRAVWGRCWESGGAPAFWPWTQALEAMSRGGIIQGDDLDARLAPLLPRLRAGQPAHVSVDPERDRFELYQVVLDLLRGAAARQPLLLIFDDLHAADLSTLGLLSFIARAVRDLGVLITCTFRDAEARMDSATSAVLSRVIREGSLISLGRIGEDDVLALLQERGIAGDETLAQRVFQRTEGNPLFTRELIELLAGQRGAAEELPIPLSVRETIRQRVASCDDELRKLLVAAAVIGKEHDSALVARTLDSEPWRARMGFDQGVERGLLVARGEGQYAFSHVLVRDVMYADTPAREREELHAAAAEALLLVGGTPARHAERTHHLLLAGPSGHEGAVTAAVAAARDAASFHAHEDAVALLERTQRTIQSGETQHLVCDLLLALGATHVRAGNDDRGKQTCLEAADIARRLSDPTRLARAALAYGGEYAPGRSDQTLISMIHEAREGLPQEEIALHARLLARLAAALQPAFDPREPVAMAREAIELARAARDPAVLLEVLYAAMGAFIDYARPKELLPLCDELRRLCVEAGDRPKMLRSLLLSIFVYLEAGRRSGAEALVEECHALAESLALPQYLWVMPMLDAGIAAIDGAFADAERLIAEAERIAAEAGVDAGVRIVAHRYATYALMEDDERLPAASARVAEMFLMMPHGAAHAKPTQALGALRQGDAERAAALVGAANEVAVLHETAFIEPLAEVWATLRIRTPLMERCYQALLPDAEYFFSWGVFACTVASPVERTLGLLADALDMWPAAEQHFLRAIERCEMLRHRPMEARVRFDLATALARRGEVERAAMFAQDALDRATALGMPGLIKRAGVLCASLGGEALQDADRSALAELAAGIAHEINTPLSAIQSNIDIAGRALDIIKEAMGDPELGSIIAKNRKLARAFDALGALKEVTPEAAGRIQRVVLDLTSYARVDRAAFDAIDLHESIDGVLRLLGHRIGDDIAVERELGDVPRVRCHPQRLNDALMAVCSVALARIEGRGAIALSTRAAARSVVITVQSSGKPFSAEEKERLFDPSLEKRGAAVGLKLDLAIAQRTFEEHGGAIAVDDVAGGFRFRMRLPLEPRAEAPQEDPSPPEVATDDIDFSMHERGELWELRRRGKPPLMVRASRGLRILAQLVSQPDTEIHVLDLAAETPESGVAIDAGDAGEVLDEAARTAYRARARELQEDLAEAQANNDLGHIERIGSELEFIAAELSRATGLGGRVRRVGKAAERARVAVQRSLRAALKKIASQDETLGQYLDWSVRTGAFCCFHPRGRPVR